MSQQIDLNADLGEGCGNDAALMTVVSSCNIACGGHAGDEASMRAALTLAKANGVAAGAHPSFPDRENFGRTPSPLRGEDLERALGEQVETLRALAAEQGITLTHLKPHGALYNMAARDHGLAESVVRVLKAQLPAAQLVGPAGSELQQAADRAGVPFIAEGFADRAYEADGQLRDRKQPGAVIHDPEHQTQQALEMAFKARVITHGGEPLDLRVETICVHGDTPEAYAAAQAIRAALEANGLTICAPS